MIQERYMGQSTNPYSLTVISNMLSDWIIQFVQNLHKLQMTEKHTITNFIPYLLLLLLVIVQTQKGQHILEHGRH